MISFDSGLQRFNYRVVGVALWNGRVLLQASESGDFWALPGGRNELGETAAETLRREMLEELGCAVEVVRLLWLVENFFTLDSRDYHELSLYFLMRLPKAASHLWRDVVIVSQEAGARIMFRWFANDRAKLAGCSLRPTFLQTALQQLPETVRHVVHRGA